MTHLAQFVQVLFPHNVPRVKLNSSSLAQLVELLVQMDNMQINFIIHVSLALTPALHAIRHLQIVKRVPEISSCNKTLAYLTVEMANLELIINAKAVISHV